MRYPEVSGFYRLLSLLFAPLQHTRALTEEPTHQVRESVMYIYNIYVCVYIHI